MTQRLEPTSKNGVTHILLIEDDANTRRLIKRTLRDVAVVDAVDTGEAALARAEAQRYDALLMDIRLGDGLDGTQTLRALRAREGYQDVPAAALTAAALPGDREHLLDQGFDAYLSKPFRRNDLLGLVNDLLGLMDDRLGDHRARLAQ